jgi:hypothetical protein
MLSLKDFWGSLEDRGERDFLYLSDMRTPLLLWSSSAPAARGRARLPPTTSLVSIILFLVS